ncbi:MAG: hypothetical protein AB1486_08975 [Planctomycetota bacterium]
MRRLIASVLLVLTTTAMPALARVWYVGGSNPDFDEIRPAIDAAQDGDVILVRPGVYAEFSLAKGVMIRASAGTFSVGSDFPTVQIDSIAASSRGGISGMSIDTPYAFDCALLDVSNCSGEVVLEGITLNTSEAWYHLLRITDCDNVSVTGLHCSCSSWTGLYPCGAVQIERSLVRISDAFVRGGQGGYDWCGNGMEGQHGLNVVDAHLVLSGADVTGGKGGDGQLVWHWLGDGGKGGDAVHAATSQIHILGFDQAESITSTETWDRPSVCFRSADTVTSSPRWATWVPWVTWR